MAMKMTAADYAALRAAIVPALARIPPAAAYAARDSRIPLIERSRDPAMRHRWDALHASGFNTAPLYAAGLNDNHIDTALRAIVAEVQS